MKILWENFVKGICAAVDKMSLDIRIKEEDRTKRKKRKKRKKTKNFLSEGPVSF